MSVKPFFTITTVKVQTLLNRTKSDELFTVNNDNELKETVQSKIPQVCSTKVKNYGLCSVINGNLTKPRLVHNHVRNLSSSFAFNTGIRLKRQNSPSFENQVPKSLKPIPDVDFQSDDLAQIEVENIHKK